MEQAVLKYGQDPSKQYQISSPIRVPKKKKFGAGTTIRKPAIKGTPLSYVIRCTGVVGFLSKARLDVCGRRSNVRRKSWT
jgi:hypothetical protein